MILCKGTTCSEIPGTLADSKREIIFFLMLKESLLRKKKEKDEDEILMEIHGRRFHLLPFSRTGSCSALRGY
jgi:hypothetical protein